MKFIYLPLLLPVLLIYGGCADQDDNSQPGHVWQEQTETLDKAHAVEGILQESVDQQQLLLEQQTR